MALYAGQWSLDIAVAKPRFFNRFPPQVISLLGSEFTTVGLALFADELTGGKSSTVVVGTRRR